MRVEFRVLYQHLLGGFVPAEHDGSLYWSLRGERLGKMSNWWPETELWFRYYIG